LVIFGHFNLDLLGKWSFWPKMTILAFGGGSKGHFWPFLAIFDHFGGGQKAIFDHFGGGSKDHFWDFPVVRQGNNKNI